LRTPANTATEASVDGASQPIQHVDSAAGGLDGAQGALELCKLQLPICIGVQGSEEALDLRESGLVILDEAAKACRLLL
jgi:hypothetical protein